MVQLHDLPASVQENIMAHFDYSSTCVCCLLIFRLHDTKLRSNIVGVPQCGCILCVCTRETCMSQWSGRRLISHSEMPGVASGFMRFCPVSMGILERRDAGREDKLNLFFVFPAKHIDMRIFCFVSLFVFSLMMVAHIACSTFVSK